MARFITPRHARTHLPGGSDPLGGDQRVDWFSGQTDNHTFSSATIPDPWDVDSYSVSVLGAESDATTTNPRIGRDANGKPQILKGGVYHILASGGVGTGSSKPVAASLAIMFTANGGSFGTAYTGADHINLSGFTTYNCVPTTLSSGDNFQCHQLLWVPDADAENDAPITVEVRLTELVTSGTRVGHVDLTVIRIGDAFPTYNTT